MSKKTQRRVLGLATAGVISMAAMWATFSVATASARDAYTELHPGQGGYERVGRVWVRQAPPTRQVRAAGKDLSGYRRQGRLWIKDGARSAFGRGGLSIVLTKTVGLDPNLCATTDTIAVPSGTDVTYCFDVMNTSQVTFTVHDLVDDQLGTILTGFPFSLAPGNSAFVTQTATMGTMQVLNTATWTAFDPTGAQASDMDTALVTILQPSIAFTKTVGLDPNVCAATGSIQVPVGTPVAYCYRAANTGMVTLALHDLVDDQLGTILSGFPFALAPGNSIFLTQTAIINNDVTNIGTWTAYNPGPVDVAVEMDSATVTVPIPVELVGFEVD